MLWCNADSLILYAEVHPPISRPGANPDHTLARVELDSVIQHLGKGDFQVLFVPLNNWQVVGQISLQLEPLILCDDTIANQWLLCPFRHRQGGQLKRVVRDGSDEDKVLEQTGEDYRVIEDDLQRITQLRREHTHSIGEEELSVELNDRNRGPQFVSQITESLSTQRFRLHLFGLSRFGHRNIAVTPVDSAR